MENNKLNKLKGILDLLKEDTVSNKQFTEVFTLIIKTVKDATDKMKDVSAENVQKIDDCLNDLKKENSKLEKSLDTKNVFLTTEVQKKIERLQSLIDEVKSIEVKDGYTPVKGVDYFDGKDCDPSEVVSLVLKEIPPVVLDTGEQIVEKINDLELEPDKQIDASHIKNLPKEVKAQTIGFQRNIAWFDESTLVVDNPTRIKFAGAGVQVAMDAEGALVVTVAGGAAATETDEVATDSGDSTTFTILHTPNAGTLLVYNENTGQIYSPSNYTNTTTSIIFNSSLAIEGETPVVRAKYAY